MCFTRPILTKRAFKFFIFTLDGDEGMYLANCQSNLVLPFMHCLYCSVIS